MPRSIGQLKIEEKKALDELLEQFVVRVYAIERALDSRIKNVDEFNELVKRICNALRSIDKLELEIENIKSKAEYVGSLLSPIERREVAEVVKRGERLLARLRELKVAENRGELIDFFLSKIEWLCTNTPIECKTVFVFRPELEQFSPCQRVWSEWFVYSELEVAKALGIEPNELNYLELKKIENLGQNYRYSVFAVDLNLTNGKKRVVVIVTR